MAPQPCFQNQSCEYRYVQKSQRCDERIAACGRKCWLADKSLGVCNAGFFTGVCYQQGRLRMSLCRATFIAATLDNTTMRTSCNGTARPLDGYPSLAEDISSDPDRTSLVFRRFDRLAVRNLLYLQSELVELEAMQVRAKLVRSF